MISQSLLRVVVSHGLILALGLCGTLVWVKRKDPNTTLQSPQISAPSNTRAGHSSRRGLSSRLNFRDLHRELSALPVSRDERIKLKSQLYSEWAARDPEGLLAFLENKHHWPEELKMYAFQSLAKSRPDLLLDFGIRNGCEELLRYLSYGDPEVIARMIDALPASQKGEKLIDVRDEAYRSMGKNGILTASLNAANLRGLAENLLAEGRLDEFFETFGRIDVHSIRSDLAWQLGRALAEEKQNDWVLESISKLPLQHRNNAASELLSQSSGDFEFSDTREEGRRWIEKLVVNGMAEGAKRGIDDLFPAAAQQEVNRETLDWVKRFPTDEAWQPIVKEVFEQWFRSDSTAMVEELESISDHAQRERLAVQAVHGAKMNGIGDDDRPKLARLMALITDPDLLKQFDEEDHADPFADVADPFADPKDPFANTTDPFADPFAK